MPALYLNMYIHTISCIIIICEHNHKGGGGGFQCGTNSAESAHSFLLPTSAVLLAVDIRQAGDDYRL